MHFWLLAARVRPARGPLGSAVPVKMGLNWFIPALAKRRVGSSCGTTGDDLKKVWPFLETKKPTNSSRTRDTGHSAAPGPTVTGAGVDEAAAAIALAGRDAW